MPLPVRHLPIIQNWDCHSCGGCCKEYSVSVTAAERDRIEGQGWARRPEFAGVPLFVREGRWGNRYRLNHRADGSCVFLGEDGLCRIHAEFGGATKPLACQLFPYVLVPAGNHWRVGLRFACPSVTANKGREVVRQRGEITGYARQLEDREGLAGRTLDPPPAVGRQRLGWEDLHRFVGALTKLLDQDHLPIELRMRHMLALAGLCRGAKFDTVRGGRLGEFLSLVGDAVGKEIAVSADDVPRPTRIGRLLFRTSAAIYSRRDTGAKRGIAQKGRLALLAASIRFSRGTGSVPKVHGWLPDVSFEQMEEPAGPLPPESEELLSRYYRVKLESYQFFGPTHFRFSFWDGFEALAVTFPVILWLSRAFRDKPRSQAIDMAVQIVDDNFGYNPLLGGRRQRYINRILAARGELARLSAWYAK